MRLRKRKVSFDEYLVPVLPDLIYEKDGSGQNGEVLFIADRSGCFTISFESGMQCFDLMLQEQEGYHDMNLSKENKNLHLCYPRRRKTQNVRMGYFHFELTDKKGQLHILPGQIGIDAPQDYESSLKVLTALQDILSGLKLNPVVA